MFPLECEDRRPASRADHVPGVDEQAANDLRVVVSASVHQPPDTPTRLLESFGILGRSIP